MSRIDVDSVTNSNEARAALPGATVYRDDFVESGLELSVTDASLTVHPGVCHYTHSGTYYRADLGASPGIGVPSSAVTSVYVDFGNESIVADGTTPSEPFLKVGEADTTTDPSTADDTINRSPVVTNRATNTERVSTSNQSPFTEVGSGAWTWFSDPRAVTSSDGSTVFTGWVNSDGDIIIASVDVDSGTVTTNEVKTTLDNDDHANPALLRRDSDGKIVVVYMAHNSNDIFSRVSSNSEDISSFGTENTLTTATNDNTYPNLAQLNDGTIYLFWRDGNRDCVYKTSSDGGASWSGTTTLITGSGSQGVYHKIDVRGDTIDLGCTDAIAAQDGEKRDIRHGYLQGGTLYDSAGNSLGTSSVSFSNLTEVYDSGATGNNHSWIWDCASHGGTPEVVFATFPSGEKHVYHWGRYEGGSWTVERLCNAGSYITTGYREERYYSPGVYLDHSVPGRVYASLGGQDNSRIVRFDRESAGTWASSQVAGGGELNVRPVVPRDRPDNFPVMWLRGPYQYFNNGGYTGVDIVGGEFAVNEPATRTGPRAGMWVGKDGSGGTQTLPNNSYTLINFDGPRGNGTYDYQYRDSFFGEDRYVTGESGFYRISSAVTYSAITATGTYETRVEIGNTNGPLLDRENPQATGIDVTLSGSVRLWIDEGTNVRIVTYQDSGSGQDIKGNVEETWFNIVQER